MFIITEAKIRSGAINKNGAGTPDCRAGDSHLIHTLYCAWPAAKKQHGHYKEPVFVIVFFISLLMFWYVIGVEICKLLTQIYSLLIA